ncbi:hypothetical protein [Haloarchaeobius sp. HRN-SO-5]|uniref:hypothetical protein n=1 Tax=Haloarchaeobius sp. HRN-SO-5 TaxID=3446118 RepID=UPI003EBB9850
MTGLDDLRADVEAAYDDLDFDDLDRETKNELAMLAAGLGTEDSSELLERAVHLLFQTTVESGKLDFHLRSEYDVTYDEYLAGMTYDEMTGQAAYPERDDERRYQF